MLTASALLALALILTGVYRLHRAYCAYRAAQAWAAYRAAALVSEARRSLRAAKHRAQEREWGRAA